MCAVQDLHKQTMQGKYMLQLDEAVNIAAGFKDRYNSYASYGSYATYLGNLSTQSWAHKSLRVLPVCHLVLAAPHAARSKDDLIEYKPYSNPQHATSIYINAMSLLTSLYWRPRAEARIIQ